MGDSVVILDTEKPVGFIDADPDHPLDRPALMAGLREVAGRIDATEWTAAQRSAFNAMKRIVFFKGSAQVGAYQLQRPGCDEAAGVFYWEVGEFQANADPRVRANIFFHDCWHVVQFEAWGYAESDDEREAREVDALERQIEAARALGCDAETIRFLTDFAADSQAIRDRLAFGVSDRVDA